MMSHALQALRLVAAVVLAVFLVACGSEEQDLTPPDIAYGEAISEMGMFVVDPRYTVAALPEEGDWILFDDIGEVFKYRGGRPDQTFRAIWVNDFHDQTWLDAEDAWYLQSPGLHSPMGWGVAAFAEEAAAREFQGEFGGDLMRWSDAANRDWIDPPAPNYFSPASPAASPASGATPAPGDDHHHPGG